MAKAKKNRKIETFQEAVDLVDPIFGVVWVVLLIPHQGALNVRLWRHRTEAQAGVLPDDALLQFVLRMSVAQSAGEQAPQNHEESGQNGVENQVEKKNSS